MMNIIKRSSIVTLLSIFAFSAFVTLPAKAAVNPFADHNLMTVVGHDEKKSKCGEGKKAMKKGKCGEGKCGEGKKAMKKGKCGEGKDKAKKCGG
jgi:uncharacterized low-complexity protein